MTKNDEAIMPDIPEIIEGRAGVNQRRVRTYEDGGAYNHALSRLERFAKGGTKRAGVVVSGVTLDTNTQAQILSNIKEVLKKQGYQGEALDQQAGMLLYKLVQTNLLYHPKESVTIDGQKQKMSDVLSIEGVNHRQALKQLANGNLAGAQAEELAKWEALLGRVEDSISDKGHAILEVKHSSRQKSYNTKKKSGYQTVSQGGMITLEEQEKLDRALFEAVKMGNKNEINNLVMQGANLNAIDEKGRTPYDLIDDIIDDEELDGQDLTKEQVQAYIALREGMKRAKAYDSDEQEFRLDKLADYVEDGKIAEARDLIASSTGVTFNAYMDKDDRITYLHHALENDQAEMAFYILEQGVDVNVPDEDGKTALHYVLEMDEDDIPLQTRMQLIDKILQSGGWINMVDEDGKTIVDYVADLDKEERAPMLQFLTDRGGATGAGTLFAVVRAGSVDKAKALIDAGVDKDIRDENDFGVMHYATECKANATEMAKMLVALDVDVNMEEKNGATALHLLAQNGNYEFASALLSASDDVDVNAEDKDDNTPLHYAVQIATQTRDYRMVQLLISKGAEVDAENDFDQTPIDMARELGDQSLVQMLDYVAKGGQIDSYVASMPTLQQGVQAQMPQGAQQQMPQGRANTTEALAQRSQGVSGQEGDRSQQFRISDRDSF